MTDQAYLIAVILLMGAVTFLTRVLPFLAFSRASEHPMLDYLGRYMPPVIMTIMVVYSLQDVVFTAPPYGTRELLCVLVTALVHRVWRNALLSIFAGTALYVVLLQSGLL